MSLDSIELDHLLENDVDYESSFGDEDSDEEN